MARDAPPLYWCDVTEIISATYCFGAILNRQGERSLVVTLPVCGHVLLQQRLYRALQVACPVTVSKL